MTNANPKPNWTELATIQDGRDITRGYLGPLLTYQDKILQMRGGGDLEIYEEILRDDMARAAQRQRREGMLAWPWEVRPGRRRFQEETEADRRAADLVREMLDGIPTDSIFGKMHYGFWYGYAIAETLFATDDRWVVWDDSRGGLKVKKAKRFRFDSQGQLRLLTYGKMHYGEALPPEKFWHFCYGADNDDDPYGLGDAHFCYWPVTIKRQGLTAWLTFLRRFALGFPLGKYPAGTPPEEQAKLKRVVEGLASDAGGIIPEGMAIDLLEARRSGNAEFSVLDEKCDDAIARIILGETMTIDAEGGQYKGETHLSIQQQMILADSDALCASFSRGPVRQLIEYNRARLGDAAIPSVWRVPPRQDDLKLTSEIYANLYEIGFEPKEVSQIEERFGGQWQRKATPPEVPGALLDTEFAETDPIEDQESIDTFLDELSDQELAAEMEALLEPLVNFLQSGDGEGAMERLAELYPMLDSAALEERLARAFFLAEVIGRIGAQEEV
ncbi:DUF935 family protein [Synechococcales cyanobacterium C]|uniref:DUF935 family protein n=1 Tax=Petrachloros mirabilis ULC683 TaxID=2781853 RepID=A0A8K2ABU0_9CYAN|nr:DUF935 family protein [Petrachloros mirabilis]NCJ05196.1 DUF935 family protein [Petrachloros mirabilis ULC683]